MIAPGGERKNTMPSIDFAGNQNVADYAAHPPPGHEHAEALGPCKIKLCQEKLIVFDTPQLFA